MTFLPSFIPASWTSVPWVALSLSGLILVWIVSEVLYRLGGGIRSAQDGFSSEVIGMAMVFNLLALPLLAAFDIGSIPWNPDLVSRFGLGVAAAGTALRYWAILTLGRFFTSAVMVQGDHELIQHGPFRLLRHPGYTGVLLFGLGVALTLTNGLACVLYLLTQGGALLFRIGVEERVMRESFGERYEGYAARTWRLVPFVY